MKTDIYKIFNDIQTRTNTSENMESFISIYETSNIKEFNEVMENVFLIILKNYEKNNVVLKNIKEFIKNFIDKVVKLSKLKEQNKSFINHFCKLFTNTVKRPKHKNLCIYFLNIFLIPYSNNQHAFYDTTALEEIKYFILNILKGKQQAQHFSVMKLLQKHPVLQKEREIWERLENLLNNSNQVIKKEILKLLQIENSNILNYLLEMYDDDSIEIRHFVYEKLGEVTNFDLIDASSMVKLFYVGLGYNTIVQASAKTLLKNYLDFIGIYKKANKEKDENRMLVDDEDNEKQLTEKFQENVNLDEEAKDKDKEQNNVNEEEKENEAAESAKEKIRKSSSPMRIVKKKLYSVPSRVFDKLDIGTFYNHPKYSYTFQLITETIIEFTDSADLLNYLKNIIDNLTQVTNYKNEMKYLTEKKKRASSDLNDSILSIENNGRFDKKAIFNDILFLQNCIKYFANKQDESSVPLKNSFMEILPDNKTFSHVLNYFYKKEPNVMILHQLFLISFHLQYDDEIGNREIINVLKKFIADLKLENFTMLEYSFKPLNNVRMDYGPNDIDEFNSEEPNPQNLLEKAMENILLPPTRKTIQSMEDLIEHALKVLYKIHYNQQNQLFTTVMESLNEISESLEVDKENEASLPTLKAKQKDILERVKDKMATIASLEDKKNKEKNRLELDKKIKKEKADLESLDDELFNLIKEEKNILCRKLKLCEFLIKYCKLPVNMFENMVTTIILPTLSRKDFPEVFKMSFNAMGLLSINFFNSNYKNFLRLFYDQIEKNSPEFTEFEMLSLFIIFDSILQNNMVEAGMVVGQIDEKIELIIKKYLYHKNIVPRVIAFTGLCKLLIAGRIGKPEYVLARLIVVLYKSMDSVERAAEDFSVKIFEIMQSFLYAYFYGRKGNTNNMIKAILIIMTAQLVGDVNPLEKSVTTDFYEIKTDFINQFIMIVNDFASGQINIKKILFKIFKYIFFIYKYGSGDFEKAIQNEEEMIKPKKFQKYNLKKNLKMNISKLLSKTQYDKFLINEMVDESSYQKLHPFLLSLDDIGVLNALSEPFYSSFEKLRENNFAYEHNGCVLDLSSEEKQVEMKEYVSEKEPKYYKQIEEYLAFLNLLKGTKHNIIEEEEDNSRIHDESNIVSNIKNKKQNNESNVAVSKRNSRRNAKEVEKNSEDIDIEVEVNDDENPQEEIVDTTFKKGIKRVNSASPSPKPKKKATRKKK